MGYRLGLTFLSEVEENPDLVSLKLQKGGPMALIANDKVLAVMLSEKEYQALLEKENPQMDPGRGVRKVGNFVRSRMEGLISSGRLPENEVQRLCDRAYCKAVFRMGYPVLREIPDSLCPGSTKTTRLLLRCKRPPILLYKGIPDTWEIIYPLQPLERTSPSENIPEMAPEIL